MHPAIAAVDLVILDVSTLPTSLAVDDFETNVCAISWYGLMGPMLDFAVLMRRSMRLPD